MTGLLNHVARPESAFTDDPDASRALTDARKWAAENRERIDAEWDALPDGRPWRLKDHIEAARKRREQG